MEQTEQNIFKNRRRKLLEALQESFPEKDSGIVLLFSGFENHKTVFRQESTFYYFTGITEPGVVFCLLLDGREVLFVPEFGDLRSRWICSDLKFDPSIEVRKLGKSCKSYWLRPSFDEDEYAFLIRDIKSYLRDDGMVFALLDRFNDNYFSSIYRFEKLLQYWNIKEDEIADISKIIARLRRKKDQHELGLIRKAIDITCRAFDYIEEKIEPGLYEYKIQAEIEKVFTASSAKIAFPSIIASGKNSTILHYMARDQKLTEGDLVVIDIGAEVDYYCSDLTRTYPVCGKLTPRQKEVYKIVLDTQKYVASVAKSGMFLQNPLEKDNSLHHLATEFLSKYGYDKYFVHGIGHFLGLDVHDVGDPMETLGVGDVITIEPGIYIPDEDIGVRIEDDFLITSDGCEILSKKLGWLKV